MTEQQKYQLAHIQTGVRIRIRYDGGDQRHNQNFSDWILAQFAELTKPAPIQVALNEYCADNAAHYAQSHKRYQLKEYPRFIVFHVEQHRMFVAKWID